MNFLIETLQTFAAGVDITGLPRTPADSSTLQIIINIFLVISGAIAVLMIVISGVRFIISQGNPTEVTNETGKDEPRTGPSVR